MLVGEVEATAFENSGPYHLVLIDPPYKDSLLPDLLRRLASPGVLAPGGIVVFEHDPKFKQPPVPGLSLHSQRTLGPAGITVLLRDL
ncbi:MAG: hypothetical protein EOP11_20225 [Proteobacteria bacterium]|nr:MAG: hypothetical protein EOP11_20225 [Pseudomonadota bacterium]